MAADDRPVIFRPAARVVMLDESNCILLVGFHDRTRGVSWWATPGGSLEAGESHEDAARREVHEETGLKSLALGPWIWTREHTFRSGDRVYHQRERVFLANVTHFDAHPIHLGQTEADVFKTLRWWTLDELEATHAEVAPRDLPRLLRVLVTNGPPQTPINAGV